VAVAGSVCAAGVLVFPIAYATCGWQGVGSALVACGTCCGAGLAALGLVRRRDDPRQMQSRVLWGMLPRTGIPLAVVLIVRMSDGPMAKAGFIYYILAFYFVMLFTETLLLIGHFPRRDAGKRVE